MARTKKTEEIVEVDTTTETPTITKLAIDYPTEGLNDIARKINEIIDHLHG